MKKYAVIVTSLMVFGSALQTQSFAQADAGSSGSSGSSGAATGSSQPGADTSGGSSATSGQSGSSLNSSSSSQPGASISEPSGAQAGQQQQAGAITLEGTVSSETEKKAIETQVMQLPGVTSVHNMLQVQGQSQGGALSEPSGAQGGPASGTSGTNSNSGSSSGSSSSGGLPQSTQPTP